MSSPMIEVKQCFFCAGSVKVSNLADGIHALYGCECCGQYVFNKTREIGPYLKNETASFLLYNKRIGNKRWYIGDENDFSASDKHIVQANYLSEETIRAFFPSKFSDKIDRILMFYSNHSEYMGFRMSLSVKELSQAYFIERFNKRGELYSEHYLIPQISLINEYLKQNSYLSFCPTITGNKLSEIYLLPNGWKRVDELERNELNNRKVFVSMAFNRGTVSTREAIREGITQSGYSAEFLDEIIHNHQIVPEMLRLIRECRFLILDITDPNYGAYYEAGYALGLGKEVIVCCSKKVFNKVYKTKEQKKYQKYLKPHFDIAQKQILVWNDHEDLTHKLTEWIKALMEK